MKKKNKSNKACLNLIVAHVAKTFSVPVPKLMSKSRTEAFAIARHVVFYIARNLPSNPRLSYDAIGDFFGLCHSTVVHGCSSVQDCIDTDADFAFRVGSLTGECIKLLAPAEPALDPPY